MFINFWYPVAWSSELGATPQKVRMLGHNFVVFRDKAGKAHCLSDICIHRYASLSAGKVRDDCVQCPYHGWRFDAEGRCVLIPSLGENGKIPPRARVDSYPTQEKYGLIFAFLGDLPETERPPIQHVPEWGQVGWKFNRISYVWNVSFQRAIENALDPAHTQFVHPAMGAGTDREFLIPDVPIQETSWGAGTTITFYPPKPKGLWSFLRKEGTTVESGTGFHGATHFWTKVHINEWAHSHQYGFDVPVDEYSVRIFFLQARNFLRSSLFERSVDKRTWAVANQDRDVIHTVSPTITPRRATAEVSVRADILSNHYRKRLAKWESLGWRIDTDKLAATDPRCDVFAIPSPGRRIEKSWCIEAVPLVVAQTAPMVSSHD